MAEDGLVTSMGVCIKSRGLTEHKRLSKTNCVDNLGYGRIREGGMFAAESKE